MHFRLRRFTVGQRHVGSDFERMELARYLVELQRHLRATNPRERAQIEVRLRELKRPDHPGPGPACLIESLPTQSPDREWLVEALAALEHVDGRGGRVQLQACEAAEGPEAPIVLVAFARGRQAEVRPGDIVCAGVALRRTPDAELELFPRLYRAVCANGTIHHVGTLPARASDAYGLRAELTEMLGGRALEADVAELRQALGTRIGDPLAVLCSTIAGLNGSMQASVRRELVRGADASLWDLLNAVTAAARGLEDWSARLDLEREAGGLLALLRRPLPAQPLGLALQPPREDERLEVHA